MLNIIFFIVSHSRPRHHKPIRTARTNPNQHRISILYFWWHFINIFFFRVWVCYQFIIILLLRYIFVAYMAILSSSSIAHDDPLADPTDHAVETYRRRLACEWYTTGNGNFAAFTPITVCDLWLVSVCILQLWWLWHIASECVPTAINNFMFFFFLCVKSSTTPYT